MIDLITDDSHWWSISIFHKSMFDSDVHRGVPNRLTEKSFSQQKNPKIKLYYFYTNHPRILCYRIFFFWQIAFLQNQFLSTSHQYFQYYFKIYFDLPARLACYNLDWRIQSTIYDVFLLLVFANWLLLYRHHRNNIWLWWEDLTIWKILIT